MNAVLVNCELCPLVGVEDLRTPEVGERVLHRLDAEVTVGALDSRQASTLRLYQSITATREWNQRTIGREQMSAAHTGWGRSTVSSLRR